MYPKFTTPKTLTSQEQGRLLRAVRAQGSRRDRAILSLALGTGLRLREIAGLNVGDVFTEGSAIAWKVRLDPKITKGGRRPDVRWTSDGWHWRPSSASSART
jgi:integrase